MSIYSLTENERRTSDARGLYYSSCFATYTSLSSNYLKIVSRKLKYVLQSNFCTHWNIYIQEIKFAITNRIIIKITCQINTHYTKTTEVNLKIPCHMVPFQENILRNICRCSFYITKSSFYNKLVLRMSCMYTHHLYILGEVWSEARSQWFFCAPRVQPIP